MKTNIRQIALKSKTCRSP